MDVDDDDDDTDKLEPNRLKIILKTSQIKLL